MRTRKQWTSPAPAFKLRPPMNLYVGTSGYSYKEWKGPFYPEDLPDKQMLRFYGERFRSVEINNTFYRMPKASMLEAWAAEVPANFKFVLKAPQQITHIKRLKEAGDSVAMTRCRLRVEGAAIDPMSRLAAVLSSGARLQTSLESLLPPLAKAMPDTESPYDNDLRFSGAST